MPSFLAGESWCGVLGFSFDLPWLAEIQMELSEIN